MVKYSFYGRIVFSVYIYIYIYVVWFHIFYIYIYVCVCTHPYLLHPSIDVHLGCFHILAIVNNAVRDIRIHVSFWISVYIFFTYILRSGIATSYTSSIFRFLKNFLTILHNVCTNVPSHQEHMRVLFSPLLCQHLWSFWW